MGSILRLAAVAAAAWVVQPLLHAQSGGQPNLPAEAEQLFALANDARAAAGAGRLEWDPALAAAALQHCRRMAIEGPIAHRYSGEPDLAARAQQAGAHFSLIEENVAIGDAPSQIHDGWMRSPGHRANLLNPQVDRAGVAVVRARGVLYAVVDFSRAVPALTQTQVENVVANLIRVSGVAVLSDSTSARESCAQNTGFSGGSQPAFIMRWQGSDLTRLPQPLVDRLLSGQYHQAAVGSCPAQGAEGSFTVYRVAVLLY